ncbi:hypothetical protein AALP_AA8G055900 [Arabis alpina]|uniref:Uncharacterized protein n=1 Tax=Arabis alpina TaxID=50452 RepID=A0A087G564_ARAAL|nr:hypothetical protein AALP_AA8G055900 [Arabis alpina]
MDYLANLEFDSAALAFSYRRRSDKGSSSGCSKFSQILFSGAL